jgi:hypothetical protein
MELIQNNWRTTEYERQPDGRITCQSIANWAWDKHFNDPVRPDAVLLHGCKDGSLIELFKAEYETMAGNEIPIPEYWTDPAPEPEAPVIEQPQGKTLVGVYCLVKAGGTKAKRNPNRVRCQTAKQQAEITGPLLKMYERGGPAAAAL